MSDQNQDRPQDDGQQGIDRETEQRNRENETGQQPGQPGGFESDLGQRSEQPGQPGGIDSDLAQRREQQDSQDSTGLGSSEQSGGESGTGFVGSQGDQSSDYLTKGEENQDFAAEGQGAQDTSASRSDIETGQSQQRDPSFEDSSDSDR